MGSLVDKHGDDLNAMARDRKLNAMQHTVSVLRELVVSYVVRNSKHSALNLKLQILIPKPETLNP